MTAMHPLGFGGVPLFSMLRAAAARPAGWGVRAPTAWGGMRATPGWAMRPAPAAPLFSRTTWATLPAGATAAQRRQAIRNDMALRQQAYRSQRSTPAGDAWRSQAQSLAQHSWQRYLQVAPNTHKLDRSDSSTRNAVQGILRDIQIARASLNDRQLRAKAAEMRALTDLLRRDDIKSVRVVPSSSAGRTPDFVVTLNDKHNTTQRVELRTLAQGAPLGSRRGGGPPPRAAARPEDIAQAIRAKIYRGQLTSTMPNTPSGGEILIRMEGRGAPATQAAIDAVNQLEDVLAKRKEVEQIAVQAGSRRMVFTRQGGSNKFKLREEPADPTEGGMGRAQGAESGTCPVRRRTI